MKKQPQSKIKIISSANVFGVNEPLVGMNRNADAKTLQRHYTNTVFTVARRTAERMAQTPLRLYSQGTGGSNRYQTNSLSRVAAKLVANKVCHKRYVSGGEDVSEVLRHPALDLLRYPNPILNGHDQLALHMMYLDISGISYWKRVDDNRGVPAEIYILPPSVMKTNRTEAGVPINYIFADNEDDPIRPDELLITTALNLMNPYGLEAGTSPVLSIIDTLLLQDRVMNSLKSILNNQGQPSGILTPKGESDLTPDVAERWRHKYRQFVRSGSGDVLVLDESAQFTPLTYKPTDLAVLEIMRWNEEVTCQAFDMPLMILKGKEGESRSAYQTALRQWFDSGLYSRLRKMEAFLNFHLLPLFEGQNSNLFFCFDDPTIAEDKDQMETLAGYVKAGIYAKNEARAMVGMPPSDDPTADKLADIDKTNEKKPNDQAEPEPVQPEGEPDEKDEDRAYEIVTAAAMGTMPVEAAKASLMILCHYSEPEATQLLAGIKDKPATPEPQPPKPVKPAEPAPQPAKALILPDHVKALGDDPGPSKAEVKDLEAIVAKHLRKWGETTLGQIEKQASNIQTKGLPAQFVPVADWSEDLANEVSPVIEVIIERSADELLQRVGASPDVFNVFNPKVKQMAETAALNLSETTLATTTKKINEALDATRQAMAQGLEAGESVQEMAKRIGKVFDQDRAFLIAITESATAWNKGLQASAIESGVVKGFKWLTTSDPCDLCKAKNGEFVELHSQGIPPRHPNCLCVLEEVLIDED